MKRLGRQDRVGYTGRQFRRFGTAFAVSRRGQAGRSGFRFRAGTHFIIRLYPEDRDTSLGKQPRRNAGAAANIH